MVTEAPKPCYRERTNGVRFTRNEHRLDCRDGDCRGCKVCQEPTHCTAKQNCSWHLPVGQLTCGRCLAAVRRNLKRIDILAALVPVVAIADGPNSETANLAGPSPDPRAWSAHRIAQNAQLAEWAAVGRITDEQWEHACEAMPEDDEFHPYAVTTRWQMMLSEDYKHPLPARLSITGAIDYLDRNLFLIAHDPEQDFPLLAREIRKCRQHLEAAMLLVARPEKGAPCPACHENIQASDEVAAEGKKPKAPRLRREYAHWCDDETCTKLHDDTDKDDLWRCPKDRDHTWSEKDYRLRVKDWHDEAQKIPA